MNFRKINLQLFAADDGGAGGNAQAADISANTGQNDTAGDNQSGNTDSSTKTYTEDYITKLKESWEKEQEDSYKTKGYRRRKKIVKAEQRRKGC